MHDPVVLEDGHTYERRHIERWLARHCTSPVTGVQLTKKDVFPNHALRNAIGEYFQQVFSVHRRAIRRTLDEESLRQSPDSGNSLVRTIDALMQCSLLVNAELSTEFMLRRIMDEAKTLLGAEAASVFLVDLARAELYSTVNSTGRELRIPLSGGIAGHVATTGETVAVRDAYDDERFNKTVDTKTGFRTRHIMCVPLKVRKGGIIGVVQLINKLITGEASLAEGFTADDVNFLQVFASQAATAIATALQDDVRPAPAENCISPSDMGKGCGKDEASKGGSRQQLRDDLTSSPELGGGKGCQGSEVEGANFADTNTAEDDAVNACLRDPRVSMLLEKAATSWHIDAFELARLTGDRPLITVTLFFFERHGLIEHFAMDRAKLTRYLRAVEGSYDKSVPYHNALHATSVLHMMNSFLEMGGLLDATASAFADGMHMRQLARLACLLAACVHDVDHLGLNNDFLAKTSHERALRFNDQHVNENHHVATAFALLQQPGMNFLDCIEATDYRFLRTLMIDLVLATDMASDGDIRKAVGNMLDTFTAADDIGHEPVFKASDAKQATLLLQLGLKAADLGHLALPSSMHFKWVRRLEQEFFAQGDKELAHGLPVSFLMDREKPGVTQTQTGFFDFVVLPFFRQVARAAPSTGPVLDAVMANYEQWQVAASIGLAALEAKCEEAAPAESSFSSHASVADCSFAAAKRGRRSGRARQRAAKWWASVRVRTPSP